jgi:hypothetical protein
VRRLLSWPRTNSMRQLGMHGRCESPPLGGFCHLACLVADPHNHLRADRSSYMSRCPYDALHRNGRLSRQRRSLRSGAARPAGAQWRWCHAGHARLAQGWRRVQRGANLALAWVTATPALTLTPTPTLTRTLAQTIDDRDARFEIGYDRHVTHASSVHQPRGKQPDSQAVATH